MSRFSGFLAAGSCFLLALGFSLGRLTCEPQGGRIPRLSSQGQNLSGRGAPEVSVGDSSVVRQREDGGASGKTRAGILLRQVEQIMQAPGELSRKMDLCVWVNQLGEEELVVLLEQTLSEDRKIAEVWGWWEYGEVNERLRDEARNIILTRWARLSPENALSALVRLDEKTAALRGISRMYQTIFDVWIRTDTAGAVGAMLTPAARAEWLFVDRWMFDDVVGPLVRTDIAVATDVFMQLSESHVSDDRKNGDNWGNQIIESLAWVSGSEGVLAWIDSVCQGDNDNARKQTLLNDAVRAFASRCDVEGAMAAFQRLGSAWDVATAVAIGTALSRQQPQQAFSWMQSLGSHPDYDQAWQSLAEACLETDKRMALACLEAMSGPSDYRDQLRFNISMNWLLSGDPAAAQGVPAEYRETLTQIKELHRELNDLVPGYECEVSFRYRK